MPRHTEEHETQTQQSKEAVLDQDHLGGLIRERFITTLRSTFTHRASAADPLCSPVFFVTFVAVHFFQKKNHGGSVVVELNVHILLYPPVLSSRM
jgi:hypothetical protein